MRFLVRLLLNVVAIVVASYFVPGLRITTPLAAVVAGIFLGVVNTIVRPVLVVLTFPLTLITFGLFLFVINAACLALTASVVPGFSIDDFTAAFLGALIVTVVSWILNGVLASESSRWG